jgi:4a-hydroxytetrahydrobiopterin dehydratase
MSRLFDDEIRLVLQDLPDWGHLGNALHKEFRFRGFRSAIGFVNRVAEQAIAVGHHPSFEVHGDRVHVTLTSHDDGGVSARDVALAQAIERVTDGADVLSTSR